MSRQQRGTLLLLLALTGCASAPADACLVNTPLAILLVEDRAEAPPRREPSDASPLMEPAVPARATVAAAPAAPATPTTPAATRSPVLYTIHADAPPETLVVAVGQEVRFVNGDRICHGFFSSSPQNAFQLELLHPSACASVRFAHPGTVQVYCSLHQHRQLTIEVVPAAR